MSSDKKTTRIDGPAQGEGVVPKLRFPEFGEDEGWQTVPGDRGFDQISNKDHQSDLPVLAITQEHGAIPRDQIDYHVSVAKDSLANYKVVEAGDFIISLRSFQGGIEFSAYRGICSPAYIVLRAKDPHTVPYFRHYLKTERFIKSLNINLEGIRDGKMVSWKQFSELTLPIPRSRERQKIWDCLSSLDELIAAETQKLAALKDHKNGLMRQLLPAEGETIPRMRLAEFKKARAWRRAAIGEFFETTSGGTPDRSRKEYWGGNIPWVSTSLIDFNHINKTDEFITKEGLANSSARLLPPGTILIAMYGQGKTRGKVGILDIAATTNQACAAILPKSGIDPEFVFIALSSRYSEMRALSNSGGQENLSQALIRGFPLAIPRDEEEQSRIATLLLSLQQTITQQQHRVDVLAQHKIGLMQQLFPSLNEVQAQ